ncbi:MAG: hypothetical protein AAB221_11830 [Bacteroidota bacterium]
MSYQIPSTVIWENTGFPLDPTKNDKLVTIKVNASSRWTANRNPGGGGTYDARGWQGRKPGGPGYKVPTSDEGCLVGNISGTAFVFTFEVEPITGKTEVVDKEIILGFRVDGQLSGDILLGINDNNLVGDNAGEIQVISIDWKEVRG